MQILPSKINDFDDNFAVLIKNVTANKCSLSLTKSNRLYELTE